MRCIPIAGLDGIYDSGVLVVRQRQSALLRFGLRLPECSETIAQLAGHGRQRHIVRTIADQIMELLIDIEPLPLLSE